MAVKKNKIITYLSCICIFLLCLTGCSIDSTSEHTNKEVSQYQNEQIQIHPVELVKVIDGDTLLVSFDNRKPFRVRLIGVNTPESVHPDNNKNTQEGAAASNYTKSRLKKGQTIYLEYDKDKYDDYDRTLAYVWLDCSAVCSLNDGSSKLDTNFLAANMLNAELLKNGCAELMLIEPNTKYSNLFQSIQNKRK